MIRAMVTAAFVALVACDHDADIYGDGIGQQVSGNELFVSVSNVWNEQDALLIADAHCRQFGRVPNFKGMQENRAIYDCIKV